MFGLVKGRISANFGFSDGFCFVICVLGFSGLILFPGCFGLG